MTRSARLATIAAAAVVAIAGLIAYFYLPLESDEIRLPVVDGCALHLEACSVQFPQGGSMTFEITPLRPSPADTLQVKARFNQMAPQTVGVRFKGVDMNMGYLEHFVYEMQKSKAPEAGPGPSFSGEAGVFVCARNLMQWLVLVKVKTVDGIRYEVPFRFETLQRG
ncbi:MAG: hypothetical protein OEU50_19380 [Gammaproteobacteria bacterium]|nr:hypothetical protein [Gammaproteobacteria bacterium]